MLIHKNSFRKECLILINNFTVAKKSRIIQCLEERQKHYIIYMFIDGICIRYKIFMIYKYLIRHKYFMVGDWNVIHCIFGFYCILIVYQLKTISNVFIVRAAKELNKLVIMTEPYLNKIAKFP